MKELVNIQSQLKAPKGQLNKFGGYKYRSAEDILEAVKPLLNQEDCILTITDEVVQMGERFYIKATTKLVNAEGVEVSTCAYAREEEQKKGMDGAQVTGSASSYARKYALNGLFCIDDTKDADTDEYTERTKTVTKATEKQINLIESLCKTQTQTDFVLTRYNVKKFEDLTLTQASEIINLIKEKQEEK